MLTIKGREGEGGDDGGVGFLEKKMDTAHTQGRGETQMARGKTEMKLSGPHLIFIIK